MLDFQPVRARAQTLDQLAAPLSVADLRRETGEMIDAMLDRIAACDDSDVTFLPQDPQANDRFAANNAETFIAWTLAHVIVHCTASSEESAFLAAELARGVPLHGRSRYEVPWQNVTTVAECQARLKESRRMRLASLDLWPAEPHLDNVAISSQGHPLNCKTRFLLGLVHDQDHLGQISDIVRQARVAREGMAAFA